MPEYSTSLLPIVKRVFKAEDNVSKYYAAAYDIFDWNFPGNYDLGEDPVVLAKVASLERRFPCPETDLKVIKINGQAREG